MLDFAQLAFIFLIVWILSAMIMAKSKSLFMFNPRNIGNDLVSFGYINQFTLKKWHHLYTGEILIELGIYQIIHGCYIFALIDIVFGLFLAIDDIYQHHKQRELNNPDYRTIGHNLGRPIYHLIRILKGE